MSDWNSERVRALVAAAENATQRTRWVFLVMTLGCAVMITAQLNLYGTWVQEVRKRQAAIAKKAVQSELTAPSGEGKVDAEAEAKILHTIDKIIWDDLYTVSIPLLGIKYSADDLILLGPPSMSILALWFVYFHRRENHCIGVLRDIANDAKTKDRALASYIHGAIAHHFVFTTTTPNDEPYTMLKDKKSGDSQKKSLLRGHVIFLTHLPWIASFIAVGVMAMSLFMKFKLAIRPDTTRNLFDQMEYPEQREAIIRMAVGLVFTFLTAHYCARAHKFERDTHGMLIEMQNAASDDKTDEVKR